MNLLNKYLLLEEGGWEQISCSKIENWKKKGCPTKEVAGSCYVNKSKCKSICKSMCKFHIPNQ